MNKGISTPAVIIAVVVLAGIAGGVWWNNREPAQAEWETFSHNDFSFRYPADWHLTGSGGSWILANYDLNNHDGPMWAPGEVKADIIIGSGDEGFSAYFCETN